MIMNKSALFGVAALAVCFGCVAPVHAEVVGPYGYQAWLAAIGSQPTTRLWFSQALSGYAPGSVVPGDAFAASFGLTFESSSVLIRKPALGPAALMAQSTGAAVTVRWSSPITSVYYGALGQLRINFYLGDALLRSAWSPLVEAGFTASEPFDRMEFVTQSDKNLEFAGLDWVVPAPSASALLVLCGAAAPGRRRRA